MRELALLPKAVLRLPQCACLCIFGNLQLKVCGVWKILFLSIQNLHALFIMDSKEEIQSCVGGVLESKLFFLRNTHTERSERYPNQPCEDGEAAQRLLPNYENKTDLQDIRSGWVWGVRACSPLRKSPRASQVNRSPRVAWGFVVLRSTLWGFHIITIFIAASGSSWGKTVWAVFKCWDNEAVFYPLKLNQIHRKQRRDHQVEPWVRTVQWERPKDDILWIIETI